MDHKEMCFAWVEERKFERDDGCWQQCDPHDGELIGPIYDTEVELDDVLWHEAIGCAHERFLP